MMQVGPVSKDEIRSLHAKGRIGDGTLFRTGDMAEPCPLASLRELRWWVASGPGAQSGELCGVADLSCPLVEIACPEPCCHHHRQEGSCSICLGSARMVKRLVACCKLEDLRTWGSHKTNRLPPDAVHRAAKMESFEQAGAALALLRAAC